jgi:hypothetical protein
LLTIGDRATHNQETKAETAELNKQMEQPKRMDMNQKAGCGSHGSEQNDAI